MADVNEDLHDAFRIMYTGDEWEDWANDDGDNNQEAVEAVGVTKNAVPDRYSRAYLRSALASLTTPTPTPSRNRIYASATPAPGVILSTSPLPPLDVSVYAPFSPLPLLARLRTFSPATFSPRLPDSLSPRALALAGWINNAKDGLICAGSGSKACGIHGQKGARLGCDVTWGVGGLDALEPRVRGGVVQRLSTGLSQRHAPGCGWRVLASPPNLVAQLRHLVHPCVSASLGPLARAVQARAIGPVPPRWTSPISVAELGNLVDALSRATDGPVQTLLEPLAVALALFGWYPYDPVLPPSASDHVSPDGTHASKTEILACRMCCRRIGLWLFTASAGDKVLDLANEHLWWCPLGRSEEWWRACPLLEGRSSTSLSKTSRPPRLGEEEPAGNRWKRRKTKSSGSTSATPTLGRLIAA